MVEMDSPLLSSQELAQLTPPQVGQPIVADEIMVGTPDDVMPMPHEVAQRLARFTEEVQVKQKSPLITSPPRQKTTLRSNPYHSGADRLLLSHWRTYQPPSEVRYSA